MIKTHQLRLWNVCRNREAEPFRVTDVSIRNEGRNAGQLFQAHSCGPECPHPTELPAPAPVELTCPGLQQTPVSGSRLASASTPSRGRRRGSRRWEPVRSPRGLCLGAGEEERHRHYTTTQARMQESRAEPLPCPAVPPGLTPPPPPHAHTQAGHADGAAQFSVLLGIRQTHKGLPRASFPEEADPWDHVGPGTPSRPKAGGESGQGPVVKVRRATAAKSPGQKQWYCGGQGLLGFWEGSILKSVIRAETKFHP